MDTNSDLQMACADIQARKTFVGNVKADIAKRQKCLAVNVCDSIVSVYSGTRSAKPAKNKRK
jgi:hypothetical protein